MSPQLLDSVKVIYEGQPTLLSHLAISVQGPKCVYVTPYDPALVSRIVKAIVGFGFNAYAYSKSSVAVSIPPISWESKQQVKDTIRTYGEEAKVAVRNVRKKLRQALDKDELQRQDKALQRLTDEAIDKIGRMVLNKCDSI